MVALHNIIKQIDSKLNKVEGFTQAFYKIDIHNAGCQKVCRRFQLNSSNGESENSKNSISYGTKNIKFMFYEVEKLLSTNFIAFYVVVLGSNL